MLRLAVVVFLVVGAVSSVDAAACPGDRHEGCGRALRGRGRGAAGVGRDGRQLRALETEEGRRGTRRRGRNNTPTVLTEVEVTTEPTSAASSTEWRSRSTLLPPAPTPYGDQIHNYTGPLDFPPFIEHREGDMLETDIRPAIVEGWSEEDLNNTDPMPTVSRSTWANRMSAYIYTIGSLPARMQLFSALRKINDTNLPHLERARAYRLIIFQKTLLEKIGMTTSFDTYGEQPFTNQLIVMEPVQPYQSRFNTRLPACDIPKNTNANLWQSECHMRLYFPFQKDKEKQDSTASMNLRLYKRPLQDKACDCMTKMSQRERDREGRERDRERERENEREKERERDNDENEDERENERERDSPPERGGRRGRVRARSTHVRERGNQRDRERERTERERERTESNERPQREGKVTFKVFRYLKPLKPGKKERKTCISTVKAPASHEGWISFDMFDAVREWKKSPFKNFGIVVTAQDSNGNSIPPHNILDGFNCSEAENITVKEDVEDLVVLETGENETLIEDRNRTYPHLKIESPIILTTRTRRDAELTTPQCVRKRRVVQIAGVHRDLLYPPRADVGLCVLRAPGGEEVVHPSCQVSSYQPLPIRFRDAEGKLDSADLVQIVIRSCAFTNRRS